MYNFIIWGHVILLDIAKLTFIAVYPFCPQQWNGRKHFSIALPVYYIIRLEYLRDMFLLSIFIL